ncbi:putative benzoate 4-monooxygenase cytochrome protein [Botrytis fragariae]|uniref:Putative benzoate 4-monooxygenase cytochrome protein n=1 Tax=Botrytis fragariae TaxID=1964551 RepID=A0A8H6B3D4_9HELO|nr:putative benzoate 4-monooxygenase cytochrome protein [Botrytis fragariae]KAF5878449.1 putative benzoate 4-monooxygenase cytochrome protein [Botrytis fragariae]
MSTMLPQNLSLPFDNITAIVVVAAAISTIILYNVFTNPLSRLPGPWYTKWTSGVLKYSIIKGRRALYVHDLHCKYGSIVRVSPTEVHVSDIAATRKIHNVKSSFKKSPWYRSFTPPNVLNVFNTSDIELHRHLRRLLSLPMSESSLKHVEVFIRRNIDLAVKGITEEMSQRGAADVFKWWMFMATDVIGELSFGESFKMLESGKSQKNQYILDIETNGLAGGIRGTFPFIVKVSNVIPIPVFKAAAASAKRLRQYGEQSIERSKRVAAETESHPMLLKKLFRSDENGLSDKDVVDNAMSFIIAGSDTTANTMTYLTWAVCKHPQVRDALVEELRSLPPDFTDQDLRGLTCLNNIIKETLRLYCAAPSALPRIVPAEGVEFLGHRLPGGTTVSTQAYTLHRKPEIFPNPESFEPRRWTNPSKEMKDAFMAFGGGSRVCLGQHLAEIELRLSTAIFFRASPYAKVSTLDGMNDGDMDPHIFFLLSPKGKRCLISRD